MTKLSKLLVLVAGLSLSVAVSGTSADFARVAAQMATPEWQRYKVDDEKFSVLLPVVPAMTTTDISYDLYKTRRVRTLASYADGVVYVVETFEKKGISFDDLLRRIIPVGKLEDVSVDGIPGKSAYFEDEKSISTTRFFNTSNTVYQFGATASKLGNHSDRVLKFFSSIRFSNNPEGLVVIDGPGEQPLTHANGEPVSISSPSQLTVRQKVVSKPEPRYTAQARQNQVTGTVVLRGILSSSGAVENISVIKGLADGLNERAILAARKIRFIPGIKDGQFVSTWIQLEYNYNLY